MPRAKTRVELLNDNTANFTALLTYINNLEDGVRHGDFKNPGLNKNIRDVLAHLHHWHLMFLKWYEIGMTGEKPDMPAKGYKWNDLPELNKKIWNQYKEHPLEDVHKLLKNTHDKIQLIIERHTDEELFTKKKYKWTGSTSMGAYLVSTCPSHYIWALNYIRKSLKCK